MRVVIISVLAASVIGCATGPNIAAKQNSYDLEMSLVKQSYSGSSINELQRDTAYLEITKRYWPADAISIDCFTRQVYISQDYIGKKITKQQASDAYQDLNRKCNLAWEANRANLIAQADEEDRLRRAVAISAGLSKVGKAAATSWGQSITPPSTICNAYGGTAYCYPPY